MPHAAEPLHQAVVAAVAQGDLGAHQRVARLEEATGEAKEAARLARLRFDVGVDSFLAVLDADRTRIELDDLLAQARTDRATALAALFKALGGDFAMADRTR